MSLINITLSTDNGSVCFVCVAYIPYFTVV